MKILPFGLRSSHSSAFASACSTRVLRLLLCSCQSSASRNYSPGFWRYTGHRSSLRLIPVLAFRFRPFSETNFSPHSRPDLFRGLRANWGFDQLIASAINCSSHCAPCFPFGMVGSNGLGPSTSRLSGVCSNQLSYEPIQPCGYWWR